MNFTKQNNPVVIGLLVVILAGALVVVFQQVKKVQASMAMHRVAPADAPSQTTSTAVASDHAMLDSYVRPAFDDDPFKTPILPTHAGQASPLPRMERIPTFTSTPQPLTIRPLPLPAPRVDKAASKPAAAVDQDIAALKVTAVLKGQRETAIIEGAGTDPVAVSIGGKVGAYRVMAIHDDGVVLASRTGIYTISLTNVPEAAEGSSTAMPSTGGKPATDDSDSQAVTDSLTNAMSDLMKGASNDAR